MTKRASWWALVVVSLGLSGAVTAGPAQALRCGDDPADAAAVAAAREALKASCNCSAVDSRARYLKCVNANLKAATQAGQLPLRCRSQVTRCARGSVIGRPGAVVCCRTDSHGRTRGRIVKDAAACRPPINGSACTSEAANICDGCETGGCVVIPTPTSTPPPTPTSTPPPTPTPAICPQGVNFPPLGHVPAKTLAGTTDCGGASIDPNPAPPFSGALYDTNGVQVKDLGLGCQYVGALPPTSLPDGATSIMDVVGISASGLLLAGGDGDGPSTCTRGAAMTRHCVNGGVGTDGNGACTTDSDCGVGVGACGRDANCFFGAPIPVANGALSACVVNAFLDDLCGHVDFSGTSYLQMRLSARVYATGNPDQPCPLCVDNQCDSGPNQGSACTPIGSKGTSASCLPNPFTYVATLEVPVRGLTTATAELVQSGGYFCPVEPTPTPDFAHRYCVKPTPTPSAFGIANVARIVETGAGLGSSGLTLDMNLAGVFCVPPTGSILDLAVVGPGAVSVKTQIDLSGVVGLPGLPPLPLP